MSNNTTCNFTPAFNMAKDASTLLTYTVFPPVYIIFGMIGHVVALKTFLKPSKTEKAYVQQIYVNTGKIVQIICCSSFYILFYTLAGQDYAGKLDGGFGWFKRNYPLMWYTAYIAPVFSSAMTTVTTLLTACMATDRAVSLSKPLLYKTTGAKVCQVVGLVLSWLLGLFFSVEVAFRYILVKDEATGNYLFLANPAYSGNVWLYSNSQGRNATRALGLVVMIAGSAIIMHFFRKRNTKVASLCTADDRKKLEAEIKSKERNLSIIAMFQAVTVGITSILPFVYNVSLFVAPQFGRCEGVMTSIMNDILLQIMNTFEFYMLFLVNKNFRASVLDVVRPITDSLVLCKSRTNANSARPTAPDGAAN